MADDDDIIAFEEYDEQQPQPQQLEKPTKSSLKTEGPSVATFKQKKNRFAKNQLTDSGVLPKEIDSEENVIDFSKKLKVTKDAKQANPLKVESILAQSQGLFLKPNLSQRDYNDEENEPAIIKLEDPEDIEQKNEDDILVIGRDNIESHKRDSSRVTMKAKSKNIQEEILEKFDGKDLDEQSPKIINQSINVKGGTTEPFPASDENRQENIDTIFSQSLKIGLQSSDVKLDYYGISTLSTQGTLFTSSLKMAMKRALLNPILPFLVLITILDALFTSIAQWMFVTGYIAFLAIVPTICWYQIYKQELSQEFRSDRQQVSIFDFSQKRFINRFVTRLYPGAFIQLHKGDRLPAPILVLTSEGQEISSFTYGDETRTYRCLTPKLQEGELNYLDGCIEYNQLPLFSNGTKARLRLDLIDPIDIALNGDNLVEEYGIVESTTIIGIALHSSQKQKYYREALSFNLPIYINPLKAEFFSIGIAVVLALCFSVAGVVWSKENADKHMYIQENTSSYSFFGLFVDRLVIFSNVVPVFMEIILPLFLLVARSRINSDLGMDPQRSGQLTKINSYLAIDNLANTKFVNYGPVMNDKKIKVTKATLIGGPIQDEENEEIKLNQYQKDQAFELKPNKELKESKDLKEFEDQKAQRQVQFEMVDIDQDAACGDIARRSYIFERTLLSLPFGMLNEQQLAIQKFCQLGECVQFAYDINERSILLPRETLKTYTLKLIVQSELWDAYLFEQPRYEEKENESDEEEASDLQQLQDRIKRDREMFERMNTKRFIWVLNADLESNICKEHPQLSHFTSGRAIFEYEFLEDNFKKLYKQLGKAAFSKKFTTLPPYVQEELFTQIKPIGVYQFEPRVQHNFHLCLDLNLAIVRQWFFIRDVESDTTFAIIRQYMECIEFTKDDLQNEMNHLKSQSVPLFRQSLRDFKVFDNLYKIDDKFIAVIINSEVLDYAMNGDLKFPFLEVLMIPSFVVFQDLNRQQTEQIIQYQKEQAKNQTIVTVGRSDKDLLLCRANTIRACVIGQTKGRSSLFASMAHVEFSTLDALSKLILTHARQTHVRQAGFVLFQLYKSFLIVMCEFFFSFFNGYSASQLFTTSFHFMYQTYFTSLYGFLIFYFYSDVTHKIIRLFASEFIKCQRDYYFNRKKLILIFIDSIYQGFIIFYLPANILQYANNENGIIEGFYYISLVSYMTVIVTALIQPLLYLSTFSKEQILVVMFNFILMVFAIYTTCSSDAFATSIPQYTQHLFSVLNNVKSVFIIIFLSAICLTPSILIQQYDVVADTQLSKMIHYYEERELEEDKQKDEQSQKKEPEKQQQTSHPVKSGFKSVPEMAEQTHMDQMNMSSDQLIHN